MENYSSGYVVDSKFSNCENNTDKDSACANNNKAVVLWEGVEVSDEQPLNTFEEIENSTKEKNELLEAETGKKENTKGEGVQDNTDNQNEVTNKSFSTELKELAPGVVMNDEQISREENEILRDKHEEDTIEKNIQKITKDGDLSPKQRKQLKNKNGKTLPGLVSTRSNKAKLPQRYQ